MKICIILNGEVNNYKETKYIIENQGYDYIICCDGGANHTYNMDIVPQYIIGDLDSIKEEVLEYYKHKNVVFKKFPTKKDETDMELGIYLAKTLRAKRIDFIGALGGRIDHTIANINILSYIKSMNIECNILSENESIHLIRNEKIEIQGNKDEIISIIPVEGDAKKVTLRELEYPLNKYNMKYGIPLGISNVMKSKKCTIEVEDGSLLIVHQNK